jgi:hypothetical protein
MMPEDPLTDFYNSSEKSTEGENGKDPVDEDGIIILDGEWSNDNSLDGIQNSSQFPVRNFRSPPPLNRSIAGAARERADRVKNI